ncbi:MAG: YjbF family lipoprotein [Paracoccaceae bacterium]
MGAVLEVKSLIYAGIVGMVVLAGCGNDVNKSSNTEVARALAASTTARFKGTSTSVERMTRARLAEVVTPVMLLSAEASGKQALIAEIQTSGGVETWSTVDDITVSMRNGVIVATRGFGADLMAASVPVVSRDVGNGQIHKRVHTLLDGEDKPVRTHFTCTFQNHGVQVIDIVQIKYNTTHVTEDCLSDAARFQNRYWISDDRQMRKSTQWISPGVGFLTIEDVRR